MRRTVAAGVLALSALALTACVSQGQAPGPQVASSFTPERLVDEDTRETISPDPAVWDDRSRAAAVAAAEAALEAFAQPDLDHDAWWDGLESHLTQGAAQDYVWVDPARIAVRKLTGPGTIIEDSSAYVATVMIPTDAGRYDVLVIRASGSSPWLASRFMPVQEAGR